jgi:hypothetical protein
MLRTNGECDAVHGGQKGDGRHRGGTDLDADARDKREHRVSDVAEQTDEARADEQAPEESDGLLVSGVRGQSHWGTTHLIAGVLDLDARD